MVVDVVSFVCINKNVVEATLVSRLQGERLLISCVIQNHYIYQVKRIKETLWLKLGQRGLNREYKSEEAKIEGFVNVTISIHELNNLKIGQFGLCFY